LKPEEKSERFEYADNSHVSVKKLRKASNIRFSSDETLELSESTGIGAKAIERGNLLFFHLFIGTVALYPPRRKDRLNTWLIKFNFKSS